jgi:hypothetical protein
MPEARPETANLPTSAHFSAAFAPVGRAISSYVNIIIMTVRSSKDQASMHMNIRRLYSHTHKINRPNSGRCGHNLL